MCVNEQHPELRAGEVFLGNYSLHVYTQSDWKTKRIGQQAYDESGKPVASTLDLHPIFAQKSELNTVREGLRSFISG